MQIRFTLTYIQYMAKVFYDKNSTRLV